MFVSKTIYNKSCTTNQKPKRLKQKRNKKCEIKNLKNGNKQREKYLLKKYKFSILDSQLLPILVKRNVGG